MLSESFFVHFKTRFFIIAIMLSKFSTKTVKTTKASKLCSIELTKCNLNLIVR